MFQYQAFKLNFITPFQCPQLLEMNEADEDLPKVTVSYGAVPENLENPLNSAPVYEATNTEFLMRVEGIGRYLIRNGDEIIIDPHPDATEVGLRLFLFGSAMGALLNQRGYYVLHASSIATEKGAVLFTGHSGAGKSTTVQAFIDHGYKKLSDDTVALYYDEVSQKVMVLPSFPNTKLWQKSAQMLGKETEGRARVNTGLEKFNFSTKENFINEPMVLHAIYQLLPTNECTELMFDEPSMMEKFKLLFNNTYRRRYAEKLSCKENHFRISTATAKQARIKRLKRPEHQNTIEALVNALEKDFNA